VLMKEGGGGVEGCKEDAILAEIVASEMLSAIGAIRFVPTEAAIRNLKWEESSESICLLSVALSSCKTAMAA
jgi:hypothetical protein